MSNEILDVPGAILVLDFPVTDEQKKKLLDGLCRLITRCDVQALKVGVKSPPNADGVAGLEDQAPSHQSLMPRK